MNIRMDSDCPARRTTFSDGGSGVESILLSLDCNGSVTEPCAFPAGHIGRHSFEPKPPVEIAAADRCDQVLTFSKVVIGTCDLPAGHEGKHSFESVP